MRPRLTRITCFHRCSGLCRNFPRWSKSCLKVISVDLQAVSAGPRWATYFIIYKLLAGTYLYKYLLNTSSHNGDYIVPFSASKQTHCALVICGSEWVTVALHSTCFEYPPKWCVIVLFGCCMGNTTRNWYCLGAYSGYTIQWCTRLQGHFIHSHLYRVHMCLAVMCHLHFCQTDWDHLCATTLRVKWI